MNLWYCCGGTVVWIDPTIKLKRIFKKMPDQFGIKNNERQLSLIRSFHASLSRVLSYYKLNFKSCFGSWLVKVTCSDTNRTLLDLSPSFCGPSSLFSGDSMALLFSIKMLTFVVISC